MHNIFIHLKVCRLGVCFYSKIFVFIQKFFVRIGALLA